ncbi:CAP domain-containing protein [Paracoccus sp. ME4]|uniref:CAP domain-containing protein n=1 Tax=Paracoccus sp. ME4 TaxID=3138066 RepID=UPI00398ADFA1
MRPALSCAALLALILTTGGALAAPACTAPPMPDSQAMADAVNRLRAQAGAPALQAHPALARAAADQACAMAGRGRLSHAGGGGVKARTRAAGYGASAIAAENIAAGQPDAGAALSSWAASGGHRANLLNPRLRHLGIGRAVAADGRTPFWSLVLAAPR